MDGHDNNGQVDDNSSAMPMDPSVMSDNQGGSPAQQPSNDDGVMPVHHDDGTQHHDDHAEQTHDEPAVSDHADDSTPLATEHEDGLLAIKHDALTALTPLVGNLDQSPEEKFRTTMMLIQASDDHSLVKQAYEAAQAIEDDKVKAQALLDVVNEINYFTSHSS